MSLVLARIDDRLIHGQVVVGWVRQTQANCIVVANDAVAADPMQRTLLPMAVPHNIEVAIYRVRVAAEKLAAGAHAARRVILLFASPMDALDFVKGGGELPELNVGGIRFGPGKEQLRKSVSLGPEEREALAELRRGGIDVFVQMVPGEPREPLSAILD